MKGMVLSLLVACLVSGMSGAQAQDCSDIRGKICSLTGFEPNPKPDSGSSNADNSSACDTPDKATQTQKDAVQAAFDYAPLRVKNDLCRLTNIFIVTDHASWGRWEDPTNHGGATPGKTQIAVNASDIGKTFSDKQNDNLKVIPNKSVNGKHDEVLPGRADANTLGLFYVLVHEIGHVKWHRDLPISGTDCGDPNFYSWQDISATKPRRWTKFGNDDSKENHKRSVKKPKDIGNDADLKSIYTGGFVTALASASPEEDFVESYAIRALMEVCETCVFNIKIGTDVIRVNDDGGNPDLKAKLSCVYTKYIKSSGP